MAEYRSPWQMNRSITLEQNVLVRFEAYMVNTATICMYMHGQYCYNMYVTGMVQYVCTGMVHIQDYRGMSLLTTHAYYIREGFVGAR